MSVNKINFSVFLCVGIGIIASTNLVMTLAIAQENISKEMPNVPTGTKNMSISVNDIRNATIGMDNSSFS
jgi:hypothetical protein